MTRKVIQISTTGVENVQHTQCNFILVALCDDGTLWESNDQQPDWVRLKDIPQDDESTRPLL